MRNGGPSGGPDGRSPARPRVCVCAQAELLDTLFKEINDLTYESLAGEDDIDTAPYRAAVWYYAQSMLGVRNDDYDYREVNVLLDVSTKVRLAALPAPVPPPPPPHLE